jgi:hypothetical protein
MKIGGWKTDSVFRRYNIIDEADLQEAANALDRKREKSQLRHSQPSEESQPKTTPPQGTVLQ